MSKLSRSKFFLSSFFFFFFFFIPTPRLSSLSSFPSLWLVESTFLMMQTLVSSSRASSSAVARPQQQQRSSSKPLPRRSLAARSTGGDANAVSVMVNRSLLILQNPWKKIRAPSAHRGRRALCAHTKFEIERDEEKRKYSSNLLFSSLSLD